MMNLGIVPLVLNNDVTGVWTMGGTIATALATAGLVAMAWFAWKAALRTLEGQQTHAEINALKDYMNALHALARLSKNTPPSHMPTDYMVDVGLRIHQMNRAYMPYVEALVHDVEVAGTIWRAYHFSSAQMGAEFRDAERSLVEAQDWRLKHEKSGADARKKQYDMSAQFAKDLAGWASRWQVTVQDRTALSKVVNEECAKFIKASPCCPKAA